MSNQKTLKFEHGNFSCDVDIFQRENDIVVRFFDQSKEHKAEEVINLVVVDPGYGYLILKFKGDSGLLSGFLDESVFATEEAVYAAIEFIENLSPLSENAYIPFHINRIKRTSFVEYNGE